jgi:retron-type reverse transcriptase
VAKAFVTVWVDVFAFKLMALNIPYYLVKTIQSYLRSRTFEASFQAATISHRHMRAGVAQGGLISPVLLSLYVNDLTVPSRHIELASYADDTALVTTSRKPALLVSYLESYLADLEVWLRKWRIAIKLSKCRAMLFTRGRIQSPRPISLFSVPIVWVDTSRYLG